MPSSTSKISGVAALFAAAAFALTGCLPSTADKVNSAPDSSGPAGSQGGGGAAHLGQSITIHGNDDGSKVSVTALKLKTTVRATDEFSHPAKGKKYVAVQFRIRNTGSVAYDDSPSNGAKVIDKRGQQFECDPFASDINVGVTLPSDTKIAPGGSALGYLVFQIPKHDKVAKVQFSMDSGFAETAEWVI